MIKKQILLMVLIVSAISNYFCQDTISSEKAILKQNSFEAYAYLISQDALNTKDAYSVAAS